MPDAPAADAGTVTVEGAGATVTLHGEGGSHGPGVVPAGSYRVAARFGDTEVDAGTLIVVPNQTHTIRCVAAMRLCRLQ